METESNLNDFKSMRNTFQELIEEYFKNNDLGPIVKTHKEFTCVESDKRVALEQAVRDKLLSLWCSSPGDVDSFTLLIKMCIELAKQEILVPQLSVSLLSDMFDTVTIEVAEKLFSFVQDSLPIWKSDLFFIVPCKHHILRMCNDLLRRLPRAQNTKFCGQVFLFLALFFPFSERSGLNLISDFNLENVTKYTEDVNFNVEGDVIKDIVPESLITKVDVEFFKRFWQLKEFFHNPNLCYDSDRWKEFMENSNAVFKLLSNCKLQSGSKGKSTGKKSHSYCMKYLTAPKLLIFQLNDVNFRRILFLEYSFLFQYLKSYVKNRSTAYDLKAEQLDWIKSSSSTLNKLCKEFIPEGTKFYKSANLILERENLWNKWKNDGCMVLKEEKQQLTKEEKEKQAKSTVAKRKTLAEILEESKETNKVTTISQGKTKEWTLKCNYLVQCQNFTNLPSLKKRVDDIMQDADPVAMIEKKHRRVNNMKFVWQTLKLYHQKGPARCFNSPVQAVPDSIPDYVEYLSKQISRDIAFKAIQAKIKKQAGELKARQVESLKRSKDDKDDETKPDRDVRLKMEDKKDESMEVDEDEVEVEEVELVDEQSSEGSSGESDLDEDAETLSQENGDTKEDEKSKQIIPKEGLELIAKEISGDWQKVAEKLSYKADEIEYFGTQEDDDYGRALNMLDVWFSNECDSSADNLYDCLETLGLSDAAKIALKYS